jgi:hypothetical protein
MPDANPVALAIETYLLSGQYEPDHRAWPGDLFERSRRGHDDLLDALVGEVRRRSAGRGHAPVPKLDLTAWTRGKVTPMVHGLFPRAEHDVVLALLERSVVFLTAGNVERVLRDQRWLQSAWDLANLYLSSVGAALLGPEAEPILGLSEETTCYVSAEYFVEHGRIEDFVIHEAAHVFHNCKRTTAGLKETRTREWLLDVEYRNRETFAYACEAYGWIVEHASKSAERPRHAEEFRRHVARVSDERVDPEELADIVREACATRNGWKVILRRCSPIRRHGRRPPQPAMNPRVSDLSGGEGQDRT